MGLSDGYSHSIIPIKDIVKYLIIYFLIPLHHYHYVKITDMSICIKAPFSFFMYLYIEILTSINLKT